MRSDHLSKHIKRHGKDKANGVNRNVAASTMAAAVAAAAAAAASGQQPQQQQSAVGGAQLPAGVNSNTTHLRPIAPASSAPLVAAANKQAPTVNAGLQLQICNASDLLRLQQVGALPTAFTTFIAEQKQHQQLLQQH
ncbi:unnamed protein product [Ceratitis capitata]|uniref:(Mediterranean fruit fly) hypothetical protein n=1 Tax=Ceratitis capitata TaxID=7213 RepID=A0A811UJ22_CERCA|nr:unnamed protein product [Ceratitis capitata]